jgi:hypothetical protein
MSWIHRIVFGGSCEEVSPAVDESYQEYEHTTDCVQAGETGMITVESERGWGHDQTTAMNNAYTGGRVSWWQRWTEKG